jgi:hypothetical protein
VFTEEEVFIVFYIGLTFASFSVEGEHAEMFYQSRGLTLPPVGMGSYIWALNGV